jgi:hypothetical protein
MHQEVYFTNKLIKTVNKINAEIFFSPLESEHEDNSGGET